MNKWELYILFVCLLVAACLHFTHHVKHIIIIIITVFPRWILSDLFNSILLFVVHLDVHGICQSCELCGRRTS